MNAQANNWKLGAFTRRLIVLPALVVAVSLAFTGAASAQTAFQASVKGNNPPPKPCPTTTFCGSANIAGYGPATWTLNGISTTPVSSGICPRTGLASVPEPVSPLNCPLERGSTVQLLRAYSGKP